MTLSTETAKSYGKKKFRDGRTIFASEIIVSPYNFTDKVQL